MWSGEKTSRLLRELEASVGEKRGKWFLANFIKEVLEDRIEENKDSSSFTIKTAEPWSNYRYSSFIQKNLSHAEESIWWLVDPRDFFSELLPQTTLHALACRALAKEKPHVSLNRDSIIRDMFPGNYTSIVASTFQTIKNKLLLDEPLRKQLRIDDVQSMDPNLFTVDFSTAKEDEKRLLFETFVLPFMVALGITHSVGVQKVKTMYENVFCPEYINIFLPHLDVFRSVSVPDKLRVIFLGGHLDLHVAKPSKIDRLKKKLGTFWSNDDSKKYSKDIWLQGFDLFLYLCGSEKNFRASSFSGNSSISDGFFDVGIQDKVFVVRSCPYGSGRKIDWSFSPKSIPECVIFDQISSQTQRETFDENLTSVSSSDFREALDMLLSERKSRCYVKS